MKKVFVLRTESLLASKNPTLRFGDDNTIVIPMAILQNLYRYNGVPEKKSLASQLIEYIDNIPQKDLLSEKGFEQSNGSRLRVVDNGPISAEIANLADFSRLDHRVYQVCKDLMANNEKVILISKNPNIRLKGNQLGIPQSCLRMKSSPSPVTSTPEKLKSLFRAKHWTDCSLMKMVFLLRRFSSTRITSGWKTSLL